MPEDGTHEQTVNVALGEELTQLRRGWSVKADRTGDVLVGERGRPDVLVLEPAGWPVAIEAKHHANYGGAEESAIGRLGSRPVGSKHDIETAIALVYPEELAVLDGASLRQAIRETSAFEYALYTRIKDQEHGGERLPTGGWLRGGLKDLAMLVRRAATPGQRVDELADVLAGGINDAADRFSTLHPRVGEDRGVQVAEILEQTDDASGQTRRMAMTVLINALIFHEALAQAGFRIRPETERLRAVHSLDAFHRMPFRRDELLAEWAAILERNYWPIFSTASRLLDPTVMPIETASDVLRPLYFTSRRLVEGGVTRSHDLTGIVFQRLIADRKYLSANYTRPECAALLASLALPLDDPPGGSDWADGGTLEAVQIGDFACGTGTLLSAAYQRLSLLHEIHGGDAKALHGPLMKNGLVGLDVLNIAVHLTAAMLAGSHPDTPFDGECLLTMPYGDQQSHSVAVGSNELLAAEVQAGLIQQAAATTAGGRSPEDVHDLISRVGHNRFDLVIMNPPFTRNTNHEGEHRDVPLPAYAAFETPLEVQTAMAKREKSLARQSPANGNAGLASFFTELSHRKVRAGGQIAEVLPLSALSGKSWEAVRQQWRDNYSGLIAVTIAGAGSHDASFSGDTGMAECLVVAKRADPDHAPTRRGTFVTLANQPTSTYHGDLIATAIRTAIDRGDIRRLDDGLLGTTPLLLGTEYCGHLLECPLPSSGPWTLVGIADVELAQVAYRLSEGRLVGLGQPAASHIEIPVAQLGHIGDRGPVHRDITETERNGRIRGPFDRISPPIHPVPTYPMLWAQKAKGVRQYPPRQLVVGIDSEGQIKAAGPGTSQEAIDQKAARIWATATRAHYNSDLQFNSQSLVVAMTEEPCIGGRAWPSVKLANSHHEYAFSLWSNSTLGLLLHWWNANKSQSGRGTTTVTAMPNIPSLDVRALTDEQHARAQQAFERLSDERLLPFDQIDEDPAREKLDRSLVVDVLGLPESLCEPGGPLELLRRKLAAEPQIHGGKKSRVVFTENGERAVRRSDR